MPPLHTPVDYYCMCLFSDCEERQGKRFFQEGRGEKAGTVTHALIPALRKLKQAESEDSLVYMESSREGSVVRAHLCSAGDRPGFKSRKATGKEKPCLPRTSGRWDCGEVWAAFTAVCSS